MLKGLLHKYEKVVLPVGAVLLAFGLAETSVRISGLADRLDPPFSFLIRSIDGDVEEAYNEADSFVMWRPRPDYRDDLYAISSAGLRDDVHPPVKAPGTRRVIALGDSSTFGHGVGLHETWHQTLEASVPGLEAINFGVTGYTIEQGRRRFARDGATLAPDMVIAYFGINDMQARFHLTDRQVMARGDSEPDRASRWLGRSHVFRVIDALVDRAMPADDGPLVARVPISDFRETLLALDADVRAAGARLVLISPPVCKQRTRGWPQLKTLAHYRRTLELVARERDIPLVVVLEMTESAETERPDLFLDSVHPSVKGHGLLARTIRDRVFR